MPSDSNEMIEEALRDVKASLGRLDNLFIQLIERISQTDSRAGSALQQIAALTTSFASIRSEISELRNKLEDVRMKIGTYEAFTKTSDNRWKLIDTIVIAILLTVVQLVIEFVIKP